jgi:putative PIN family toxin of toxin-antitoxin system
MIWGGKPAEIIKAAENHQVTIFVTEEIVFEISQVLNYPKIANAYQGTGLKREDLVEAVLKSAKFTKPTKKVNAVKEHPADNKFLECAIAVNADFLVSGDKHLLKIVAHGKTKVVSVADFLKLIKLH